MVEIIPSHYSIRLAAVASRKELLDLEKWLSGNLITYKETFFEVIMPSLITWFLNCKDSSIIDLCILLFLFIGFLVVLLWIYCSGNVADIIIPTLQECLKFIKDAHFGGSQNLSGKSFHPSSGVLSLYAEATATVLKVIL